MSRQQEVDITCPGCGFTGRFVIWDSVNNVLSPEAAQKLIDGSLFLYECPSCGEENQVFYACLYHDMEHRAMVQLVSDTEESVEEAFEAYGKLMDDGIAKEIGYSSGYRHRLVTDINSLREKAAILRDELDDRAVELVKLIVLAQKAGKGQIPSGASAYYVCLDEGSGLVLEFVSDEGALSAGVDREMYDSLAELVRDREPEDKGLRFVDSQWAYEFLAPRDSFGEARACDLKRRSPGREVAVTNGAHGSQRRIGMVRIAQTHGCR